jgi:flavin reductase (DIM6/NTAB) family NADH-FMN oxidoreductase RutF
MAMFPTGVAVVTTIDADDQPQGLTCSTVCSVTLEPPTLLICVRSRSRTLRALRLRRAFAVNLLHEGGRAIAERFSAPTADRFAHTDWREGPNQSCPHLVSAAHSILDCHVTACLDFGSHVVVFGEAVALWSSPGHRPLLYGLRRYSSWYEDRAT